jgi:hypothetical protein
MQKKAAQNKDFRTVSTINSVTRCGCEMQKTRLLSDLLVSGPKLTLLAARLEARAGVLERVRAALPARLAAHVASAGLEAGRLTLGVTEAVWASRLRYETERLRGSVGAALCTAITTVRIRVLPAGAAADLSRAPPPARTK